ncbi:MAG: hypothetical protein ACKO3P_01230, partial [Planctomycetaceae bacterium]
MSRRQSAEGQGVWSWKAVANGFGLAAVLAWCVISWAGVAANGAEGAGQSAKKPAAEPGGDRGSERRGAK